MWHIVFTLDENNIVDAAEQHFSVSDFTTFAFPGCLMADVGTHEHIHVEVIMTSIDILNNLRYY